MSDELKNVQDMFNDYENQKNNPNGKKFQNILEKYFTPRNQKEYFRPLPPNNGEKIVEKAYFHQVPVTTSKGKQWKKLYCLSKNGDSVPKLDETGKPILDQQGNPVMVTPYCPMCAKYKSIIDQQDKSLIGISKDTMTPEQKNGFERNKTIFKEASQYEAKLFYIMAGIDRLAEKHGKKFWRFKHNYKNAGILDKLMPVLSDFVEYRKADFSNPVNGADLTITVVDSSMPNGRTYKDVSAITIREQAPLHVDQQIANQWLSDNTSWRDVFKPTSAPNITPQEYMEMVLKDQAPYWDESNPQDKHWVFPGRPDLEQLARQRQSEIVNNTTPQQVQDINNLNDKIGNLSPQDVGTYQGGHVDVTAGFQQSQQQYQQPVQQQQVYQQQYQQPVQSQPVQQQQYQQPVVNTQQPVQNQQQPVQNIQQNTQPQYQQPVQQPVQTQNYDNQNYGDVDFDDDLPF